MDTVLGVDKRRIRQLKRAEQRGAPLNLTQAESDALHSKPNEENLSYWNTERERAVADDDTQRILVCDSARRFMLLVTVPHTGDGVDDLLGHTLDEFEGLPQEH
jgi:hypothetical protein